MEKNTGAFYHIYLNVRLLPGTRMIRVPLSKESTASHVIDKCKQALNSDAEYLLAADFNGFEKQFGSEERLYHLVKKHVLWAGLDRQVQFFIRKKKKHVSVSTTTDFPTSADGDCGDGDKKPVCKMMERETSPIKCLQLGIGGAAEGRLLADSNTFYCIDGRFSPASTTSCLGQMMAEQQFSSSKDSSLNDSWASQLNSMSNAELIQMAERQKRQVEANNAAVASKEIRLATLRGQQQAGANDSQAILSSRLHQLRQQIKAEDAQLQHLRRLRAEVEDERRRSVTARVDLQEARRVFAEKERQLKEAADRVQDLMRQLDLVRRRRLILNKENELRRLDAAVDGASGRTDKLGMTMADVSIISVAGPQYQYQRPKAAIEPFKIVPPSHSMPSIPMDKSESVSNDPSGLHGNDYSAYGSSSDYLHSKGFVAAFSAMEEVLHQTTDPRCPPAAGVSENGLKSVYATPSTGRMTPSTSIVSTTSVKGQPIGDSRPSVSSCGPIFPAASSMNPDEYAAGRHQMENSNGHPLSAVDSQRSETPLPHPVIPKVNISINRRFQIANASPLLFEERPPPDLIPASEKTKFTNFDAATSEPSHSSSSVPQPYLPENSAAIAVGSVAGPKGISGHHYHQQQQHNEAMHHRGEADKIHFRNDTLRAAKRRSWAENHHLPTTDEAEHIRLLLARAQQRGKSSLNLSWIFDQMTTTSGHHQNYYDSHQQRHSSVTAITASYPPPLPTQSFVVNSSIQEDASFMEQPTHPPPPPPATMPPSPPVDAAADYFGFDKTLEGMETEIHIDSSSMLKVTDCESLKVRSEDLEMFEVNDGLDNQHQAVVAKRQRRLANETSGLYETDEDEDDEERSAATVVEIISSDIQLKAPPGKGILRLKPKDESERGRRIRFDTLALLLDAALEGELELVKSCASKLPNVSTCTEEGITALHNAICAGHYEIVRFLVEAGADVNAEDGDGWTPLHCAASCNNLPMVKFLIERGACIFATTTNDHETPADKCEEDEEGFDGCSQFLFGIQEKLGVLNGGRAYGAYDFEGDHEDELDIKTDDALLILRREDEKEKGWWWAKRESNGEEGYVPRNYLALYPRLAAQRAGALVNPPASPTAALEDSNVSDKTENEAVPSLVEVSEEA